MTKRTRPSAPVYVLGALCAGAIAAAVLVVGPASQSAATTSRIVTVQRGVVQSTVSGSGNIQAATQLNLGFKTTGTVQHIYVHAGEPVTQGKLLAELNPQSTEVTLQQGKASLQAAEATLAQLEENEGESASGTSSTGSATAKAAASSAPAATTPTRTPTTTTTAPTSPTTTTTPTNTTTTPTNTTTTPTNAKTKTTASPTTPTTTAPATTEKAKQSAATREANLASAKASVKSDKLAVESDEQAVSATKLIAPTSGTIVSLSGEVGESVSGGGTTRAAGSEASTSSGASSTGGTAATGRSSTGTTTTTSPSTSTSSSSSAFAVLSDLSAMQLVVPLSESEVVHVHTGQPATVTVEALEGLKLAARVVAVAQLSTSNSGVVSYDVTFQLNQLASELKPGMSATAEVVVKQAEGVNVPTSAISAGTVTVVRKGVHVPQRVVTGLAGNSSTIILSGLKAGEQIALPVTNSSSATSLTSRLTGRTGSGLGGGGIGGGAIGGGGGGFPGGGAPKGGG